MVAGVVGVLALASLAVVLDEARDHGDSWFGFVSWGVLMLFIVGFGGDSVQSALERVIGP